jgi:hypothetical protein
LLSALVQHRAELILRHTDIVKTEFFGGDFVSEDFFHARNPLVYNESQLRHGALDHAGEGIEDGGVCRFEK